MAKQISILQLFFIFLLSTGLINHILTIPLLLDAAGRDAWISAIVGYLMSMPFLLLLVAVTKCFKKSSVFDWLEMTYNQTFRRIIALFFFLFLFLTGLVTIKEMVVWTQDTYLPFTPILVVAFAILAATLYISGKINVIAICAGIFFPFVVIFGLFLVVGTIPAQNYALILPILVEHDWFDILKGSLFIFGSMSELLMLMLLQHQMITKVTFKHLFLLSTFLLLFTIVPLVGIMAIFGPEEATKLKFPAFIQWRVLSIGQYFNHLDFISIYQWLSSTFIRLALILYLIKGAFNFKKPIIMQMIVCILYIIIIMMPISDEQIFTIVKDYIYLGTSVLAMVITLVMYLLIKNAKNRVSAK